MKRKFRNIVVDGVAYQWLFGGNDWFSYLLIVMQCAPKTTLRLSFYCPKASVLLYDGLLNAIWKGEKICINLHKPSIVSELIRQCRINGEQFTHKGYKSIDGIEILEQMGYICS